LGVVLALFASYFDAMTVVPLFCANFLKAVHEHGAGSPETKKSWGGRFHANFNAKFEVMLNSYERSVRWALARPWQVVIGFLVFFFACFLLIPFVGVSFFPRTDAGQFVINLKAPTGTRIELTDGYVQRVENIVRQVIPSGELNTIVSNIGVTPDLSSLFTSNSGMHTAFVQVGLAEDHKVNSFVYMARVRSRIATDIPELRTYFQSGGLVDAVLNQGAPAPQCREPDIPRNRATN
jgi:multidrug efflux pump subunit AcrB